MKPNQTTYTKEDLENCFKIVELQRDLVVRLTLLHERTKQNKEEMDRILGIANTIAQLKNKVSKDLITLSEEDRKFINKLLIARHLKI